MKTIITKNEKETLACARRFANQLKGGEVLLLQGELGAGKTTFVRGIARALGITARIKSPTFTLMHAHEIKNIKSGIKSLVHCDAYRIHARALQDIGLMDYVGRPDTVVIVEWGEKIKPLLKKGDYMIMKFEHGRNENERIIARNSKT